MSQPTFAIKAKEQTKNEGTFILEPLEQGFGHTLGNSLRRALLDSLPGAAITQVKIKGIRHQFSSLKGMSEDVIEFILNLKEIRVIYSGKEPETMHLSAQGLGEVKASQIKAPVTVSIVNKTKVLSSLADKKSTLEVEMQVEKGVGYSPAKDRQSSKIGIIPIDATFSPILNVSYQVEPTRVGKQTDLDRLIINIKTDGTVKPKEALEKAAKILEAYFKQVTSPKKAKTEKPVVEEELNNEVYKLTVEELDLPTRIANALRKGGYKTVKDLTQEQQEVLAKVKNLGEKSVDLINKALKKKEVSLKG